MSNLFYTSTRGKSAKQSSAGAILSGIASDGGLYVPDPLPLDSLDPLEIVNKSYQEIALVVMAEYFTDFSDADLKACIDLAYLNTFDTPHIAPLVKRDDVYYLELFHGPTLAFKDVALTILPHLMKQAARMSGTDREIVILTATSGDTGKAALEGFAGVEGTKIIVFFPEHGVTQIQKRQMVTQHGENAYVIGIEGNFDDAQAGVKAIFTDPALSAKLYQSNYMFSSANSINIGRLVPQIVYYFFAYTQLLRSGEIKRDEPIDYVVPTGNFGNILAAYYAKQLGLPVNRLICASNENRVLFDFFTSGTYDKNRDFVMTMSPSMDILVSGNLERLLYHASDDDSASVRQMMDRLNLTGRFDISPIMREALSDFYAGFATEEETSQSIKQVYESSGYLIDPHTAVGHAVYSGYREKTQNPTKAVIVSTASPFKFTASVMKALGRDYKADDFELIDILSRETGLSVPTPLVKLATEPVRHRKICRKEEMKKQVLEILGIS
ncbi:MAG TPA: threonine synthase [Atribacteraceae bacterium]|nr:threonine synthase [Atribacteraceae bacterium]